MMALFWMELNTHDITANRRRTKRPKIVRGQQNLFRSVWNKVVGVKKIEPHRSLKSIEQCARLRTHGVIPSHVR